MYVVYEAQTNVPEYVSSLLSPFGQWFMHIEANKLEDHGPHAELCTCPHPLISVVLSTAEVADSSEMSKKRVPITGRYCCRSGSGDSALMVLNVRLSTQPSAERETRGKNIDVSIY